jgi:hypothetical protein
MTVRSNERWGFKTTLGKPNAATPEWPAQFSLPNKLLAASDPVDLFCFGGIAQLVER